MNNEEKYRKVEMFLKILKEEIEKSKMYDDKAFKSFIIAGSYADWKKNNQGDSYPSWKSIPDINLYSIINGSNEKHLAFSLELAKIYNEIMKCLDFNLLLDLHPFYKSYGNIDTSKFNLQLTSRILNSDNLNKYPDYCWYGWKSNYLELCAREKNYLDSIPVNEPKRDLDWLKYMYMALSSYNNAVHMAALSSTFEKDENVFDEVYRYLKEISKDGMSLAITVNEKFDYLDIKKWKKCLPEFYEKYYGIYARKIIEELGKYEDDYFKLRLYTSVEKITYEFASLLQIVYEKGFMEREKELVKTRNKSQFTLPLWY